MRTYIAQNMDNNEELHSKLKSVEGELAAARTTSVKGTELLRKTEEEKEATNVEARQLREERETEKAKCKKAKQENEWLKNEMEELRAGFVAQKEELEGEYQK